MKKLVTTIIINSVSLFVVSKVLSGIHFASIGSLIAVSVVLGLLNSIIKPILQFIAFPISFLTLGLFSIVINGFVFYLSFTSVSGVRIESFLTAILASVLFGIINGFLGSSD